MHLTSGSQSFRQDVLQDVIRTASSLYPDRSLIVYPDGNTTTPLKISYRQLYDQAKRNCKLLQSLHDFKPGNPVLLRLEDHFDFISWFWGVVLANGVPVPSPPLSADQQHREQHIRHLCTLFSSPICITRLTSASQFGGDHSLKIHTLESLMAGLRPSSLIYDASIRHHSRSNLAILMLTSGSTGNAKAVQLTHSQVLAAVRGKASVRRPRKEGPFLNWIGLDHVASLVEIHIQALFIGVDQVHVHAADVVSSPKTFLRLLSHHRIFQSFAPNFFLAKLAAEPYENDSDYDLCDLVILASGGEVNDVNTCIAISAILKKFGAPDNVITPGFGMTETCAGAIYNLDCPRYDIQNDLEFASLGQCNPGIQMRVTNVNESGEMDLAPSETVGNLELFGDIVFSGYYNNEEATRLAFTKDHWFRTGDQAAIDRNGNLIFYGRKKDVININGLKIPCADIHNLVERSVGNDVRRLVVFPSRAPNAHTEIVTVAFILLHWPMDTEELLEIYHKITEASIISSGSNPLVFNLPNESQLPISALGKISRAKMRSLYENGVFANDLERFNTQIVNSYRSANPSLPLDAMELVILDQIAEILSIAPEVVRVDAPLFSLGFTSMELVRLKRHVDLRLQINFPMIEIMKSPSVRVLAAKLKDYLSCRRSKLEAVNGDSEYDPVVVFNSEGDKTPLWLIHPGVGEVLVFCGLAQHLADDGRPIFAMRARGFEAGQTPFESITETVDSYVSAIQKRQPNGPYALAGYSYGAMLAFEVAKVLEVRQKASVKFLASFNLPPHIKLRMRQLNWNMCLLNLSYFLGLTTEEYADEIGDHVHSIDRHEAMAQIMHVADAQRMAELGLDQDKLATWTELAFRLQAMATEFEPCGQVSVLDVFHAIPLKVAARSPNEWVNVHLAAWKDFCATEPIYHHVGGAHYTMLGSEFIGEFSNTLKTALKARGL
ncbi:acyl-protein synthetase [Xylariaceae sp. FL0255]|nr:acyl-protein synthetase [Xylariaceae sp. FL0255]